VEQINGVNVKHVSVEEQEVIMKEANEVREVAMNNVEKPVKVTDNRIVILNALKEERKCWSELRLAYYGPERAKSPASTSFMNQLKKLTVLGVIEKADGGYRLTPKGFTLLEQVDPQKLEGAKTLAQTKFEASQQA